MQQFGKFAGLRVGPEEFDAFIRSEIAKWSKVVKQAGLKPD